MYVCIYVCMYWRSCRHAIPVTARVRCMSMLGHLCVYTCRRCPPKRTANAARNRPRTAGRTLWRVQGAWQCGSETRAPKQHSTTAPTALITYLNRATPQTYLSACRSQRPARIRNTFRSLLLTAPRILRQRVRGKRVARASACPAGIRCCSYNTGSSNHHNPEQGAAAGRRGKRKHALSLQYLSGTHSPPTGMAQCTSLSPGTRTLRQSTWQRRYDMRGSVRTRERAAVQAGASAWCLR